MSLVLGSDALCYLAEVVLKINIFKCDKKTLKEKRETAIGRRFTPPYSILFMTELEGDILRKAEFKPYLCWRYIDYIFFLWGHGEENIDIELLYYKDYSTDWSQTSINFLDVTVSVASSIVIEGARTKISFFFLSANERKQRPYLFKLIHI